MKRNEIINRVIAVGNLAENSELTAKLVNAETGKEIEVDGGLVSATVIATLGYVIGLLENDEGVQRMREPDVITQIMHQAVKTAYFEPETA